MEQQVDERTFLNINTVISLHEIHFDSEESDDVCKVRSNEYFIFAVWIVNLQYVFKAAYYNLNVSHGIDNKLPGCTEW